MRTLGNTGLEVSEVGLGGLFLSSLGPGYSQSKKVVQCALNAEINYVDTAPTYANSEEVLGQIMAEVGRFPVISTKLGGRPIPFSPQDGDALKASVETSRKFLNRDVIELVLIHEPDRPGQYSWWTDPIGYYGPVMDALAELKSAGIVRFSGIAGTTTTELSQIVRTGQFDVVLTAFNYSLLYREAELEIIPDAKKLNMGIIAASPFQQGALSRRFDEEIRQKPCWLSKARQEQFLDLYKVVDELGLSLPELGLRFALSNTDISTVLVGPKTPEQCEACVAAASKGPLDETVLAQLTELAQRLPYRPYEEPMVLPFNRPYFGPGPANVARE